MISRLPSDAARASSNHRVTATRSPDPASILRPIDRLTRYHGTIGVRAAPNPADDWLLQLARRPDALEAFTWLASYGTPVARVYAYWVLRTLAPARAASYATALAGDTALVEWSSGCVIGEVTVGWLVSRMATLERPMPAP